MALVPKGSIADEYIGITELKNSFPKRLTMLEEGAIEHIIVLKQNRPVAVVMSVEDWEQLVNAASQGEEKS